LPSTAKQYSRSATAALPTFDRQFLDESGTPLYVLSASDGTVGEIAVTLVEWIIRRRRIKVAPWQRYPRIATLLGELPNTALPKNLQCCGVPWAAVCRSAQRRP